MRDNLLVGLILGAILAWLFFNKSRPNGTACRTIDRLVAGGNGGGTIEPKALSCGPIGGHWRPQAVTQSPGQPPTGF